MNLLKARNMREAVKKAMAKPNFKRWLIIEADYSLSYSDVETGHLRSRCRRGEISLIDTKLMRGMNRASWQEELGEFSEINKYMRPGQ